MSALDRCTPGEWSVEFDNADGGGGQWYFIKGAPLSFSYNGDGDEQRANAHMMAASKKMYAALTGLLTKYVELVNCGDCGFWDPEKEPEVIAANEALSSAENGQ